MIPAGNRRAAVRNAGAAAAGAAGAVLGGVGGVGTAAAHHSYPATYDTAQQVTVHGVVQLVRFSNPHVHIVIESPLDLPIVDASAEEAETLTIFQDAPPEAPPEAPAPAPPAAEPEAPPTTLWTLDLPGPGRASQLGLTPETLPPGTPLTVLAWPPRAAGSHDLAPLRITFDVTGRTVRIR